MKPKTKASEGTKHTQGKSRLIAGIREIEFMDGLSDKECDEILDLIAAAPMLLEALKHWQKFMHDNYNEGDVSWWKETEWALAAAEGRGEMKTYRVSLVEDHSVTVEAENEMDAYEKAHEPEDTFKDSFTIECFEIEKEAP